MTQGKTAGNDQGEKGSILSSRRKKGGIRGETGGKGGGFDAEKNFLLKKNWPLTDQQAKKGEWTVLGSSRKKKKRLPLCKGVHSRRGSFL